MQKHINFKESISIKLQKTSINQNFNKLCNHLLSLEYNIPVSTFDYLNYLLNSECILYTYYNYFSS